MMRDVVTIVSAGANVMASTMKDEKITYSFGYSASAEDRVEIPELTALVNDIVAVCEKHGVAFDLQRAGGDFYSAKMTLEPFKKDSDFSWIDIDEDLEEYGSGIPWLDAAKVEFEKRVEKRRLKEAASLVRQEQERREQHERNLLDLGIEVAGKKYKLFEAE